MIILTGGAGFIGTNTLIGLNNRGMDDILIVDDISTSDKWRHLIGRDYREYVYKDALWDWLKSNRNVNLEAIIHLGACSDTTLKDFDYLYQNNVVYSQKLWELSVDRQIPFIYASSAATYGDGALGFSDNHELIPKLKPLNAYGMSKQMFDLWVLRQESTPPVWVGLKYFNVYGPYEDHKGTMASVAFHGYHQIKKKGKIMLFKSYQDDYGHGEQVRDFIYVKDAVAMTLAPLDMSIKSGLYNIGIGKARSFNDLASSLFKTMNLTPKIEYIDMPKEILTKYQYFTEADMNKAKEVGLVDTPVNSLEIGIRKYLQELNLK